MISFEDHLPDLKKNVANSSLPVLLGILTYPYHPLQGFQSCAKKDQLPIIRKTLGSQPPLGKCPKSWFLEEFGENTFLEKS